MNDLERKVWIDESQLSWGSPNPTTEQLSFACLQRIASAIEGIQASVHSAAAGARQQNALLEELLAPAREKAKAEHKAQMIAAHGQGGVIDVDECGFSVRVCRVLTRQLQCKTLADVADKTIRDLLMQRNFGKTSLDEVKTVLAEHGMELRMT